MNKFDEVGDLIEDEKNDGKDNEYYSLTRIKKYDAQYNLIFGKRSNGKTYAVLYEGIKNYVTKGKQMAYLRRYREDFVGSRQEVIDRGFVPCGRCHP